MNKVEQSDLDDLKKSLENKGYQKVKINIIKNYLSIISQSIFNESLFKTYFFSFLGIFVIDYFKSLEMVLIHQFYQFDTFSFTLFNAQWENYSNLFF